MEQGFQYRQIHHSTLLFRWLDYNIILSWKLQNPSSHLCSDVVARPDSLRKQTSNNLNYGHFKILKMRIAKQLLNLGTVPLLISNSRDSVPLKSFFCPHFCNRLILMNNMHFHNAQYFLKVLSHGLIFTYPNYWPTRYLAHVRYLSYFPLNYKQISPPITFCLEIKFIPRSLWKTILRNLHEPPLLQSGAMSLFHISYSQHNSWELEDTTLAKSV